MFIGTKFWKIWKRKWQVGADGISISIGFIKNCKSFKKMKLMAAMEVLAPVLYEVDRREIKIDAIKEGI